MASKLGDDAFGQLARKTWDEAGIDHSLTPNCGTATGAAAILIDEVRGENAIIVVPGACFTITIDELDAMANAIRSAAILLTQLETPVPVITRALEIAREAGVTTILNPAPAPAALPDSLLELADFFTPNETEAAILTGSAVFTIADAERAAAALQRRGARNVILTLGARGALVRTVAGESTMVPAFDAGPVLETTGAGDAFCGGLAAALAERQPLLDAVRFGCATAAISVTRHGTAPSMPRRAEIDALLARR
jgi:ribokinase